MFPKKKQTNEDQCPVGEPSKGPSSEMIVNSDHREIKVVITNRDVKRCMTPEDRKRSDDQTFNENIYKNEIGFRIQSPDAVYTKNYHKHINSK